MVEKIGSRNSEPLSTKNPPIKGGDDDEPTYLNLFKLIFICSYLESHLFAITIICHIY